MRRFGKGGLSDEQYAYLLITPLIIFVLGFTMYPLLYSFYISLFDINFVTHTETYVGGLNYATLLSDPFVRNSLMVTIRFTLESSVIAMALAFGIALLLNEAMPGRSIFRAITLLPWAVSEYATAVAWRYVISERIGLINGLLYSFGLIKEYQNYMTYDTVIEILAVAYAWRMAPLLAFFLLAGLQVIPEDLYNAAKIDGVGRLKRFWHITIPYLKLAIAISGIVVIMEAARSIDLIIMLSRGGPGSASETLTYLAFRNTFYDLKLGYGGALSYLTLGVIMVITISYFIALTRRK